MSTAAHDPARTPGPAPDGDPLSPGARPLMEAMARSFPDVAGGQTDPVAARRRLAAAPKAPGPEVASVTDSAVPGPEGAPQLPVLLYRPPGTAPGEARPTVVLLHGGGWALGSLDSHDGIARGICAAARAVVVSVDYRLAPEARFPAPVEDAYAAVCWAAEHAGELGGDPDALVVAGDSAGGQLTAAAAQLARERGGPRIALQVLVYPVTDPGGRTESKRTLSEGYFLDRALIRWFGAQYFAAPEDLAHPWAAPLRADPAGLPPAHVVTAGCDPLRDEGQAYAARLREAGVPVTEGRFPGLFHGFLHFAELHPEAGEAMAGIGRAVAATATPPAPGV
jgi:acetyl esterase